MTLLPRRALAGVAALAAASGMWVGAVAPASAYVCSFDIDGPTPGSTSSSSNVTLTGDFVARQGAADRIVQVTFTRSPGARPEPVTRQGDVGGGDDRYSVPLGPLTLNGQYTARVRASHDGSVAVLNCDDNVGSDRRDVERVDEVTFGVSVRAKPPANVQVRLDAAARTAAVTWEKSGDPDIAGYTISRKVGTNSPTAVQVPAEPLRWTDTTLPSGAASVIYSVQASRNGPDAGTTSEASTAVAAPAIAVPAPSPATSPTTATPSTRSGGTGSTPTTAPFVLAPPVAGGPPATLPELSDPAGFGTGSEALVPFSEAEQEAFAGPDEVGDQPVVSDEGGDGLSPVVVLGGAALLGAGAAAFVLLLRRRANRRPSVVATGEASPPLESVPSSDLPPGRPGPHDTRPPTGLMASPFAPVEGAAAAPKAAGVPVAAAAAVAGRAAGAGPQRTAAAASATRTAARPVAAAASTRAVAAAAPARAAARVAARTPLRVDAAATGAPPRQSAPARRPAPFRSDPSAILRPADDGATFVPAATPPPARRRTLRAAPIQADDDIEPAGPAAAERLRAAGPGRAAPLSRPPLRRPRPARAPAPPEPSGGAETDQGASAPPRPSTVGAGPAPRRAAATPVGPSPAGQPGAVIILRPKDSERS